MNHCETLHNNLFDYVDKKMPSSLMLQLDMHVSECAECKRIVAGFRDMSVLMEEQKHIEPLPFAETRILQAVELRMEKGETTYSPVFLGVLKPAAISFGVAASLAVGFFIGSGFAGTHPAYSQNEETIEAVRSDLNVPEFMTDDLFYFTE